MRARRSPPPNASSCSSAARSCMKATAAPSSPPPSASLSSWASSGVRPRTAPRRNFCGEVVGSALALLLRRLERRARCRDALSLAKQRHRPLSSGGFGGEWRGMSYTGFYINLDRSRERRAEIEAQLAQHKLEHVYARFKAADGNALDLPNPHLKSGEMGCFTSHYLLLKKNLDAPKHLHVIEDDVVFSSHVEKVIRATIDNGGGNNAQLNLTGTYLTPNLDSFRMFNEHYHRSLVPDGSGEIVHHGLHLINLAA